jgi:4-hydroxy-tetrahydrodipicolinate reductase
MTKIGLLGARGRMGDALIAAIAERSDTALAGGVDRAGHPDIGKTLTPGQTSGASLLLSDDVEALAAQADVLIDFSSPVALQKHLDVCLEKKRPIVIGTTGFEPHHHLALDAAGRKIPLLQSFNMSLGVNVLAALVKQAAAVLGDAWDIEIVEMHHRHKVDAPSGTALLLGRAAAEGRGLSLSDNSERGRDGITGARQKGAIGFASLRGGSVAGDHQVIFATDQERIEIGHRAENRMIFARGAVAAALWLSKQQPGRYDMKDMLKI